MYGKHGYKTLAWESVPLHDLLPELLHQPPKQVHKTVSFEILDGVCVDLRLAASVEPPLPILEPLRLVDLGSPMSLLTDDASDQHSPVTAQSRRLRSFSVDNTPLIDPDDSTSDPDFEPIFTPMDVECGVLQGPSAAATTTEDEDSPAAGLQYYQTSDFSTFLQDESDLQITQRDVDLYNSLRSTVFQPSHVRQVGVAVTVAAQTDPTTVSPRADTNTVTSTDTERLLEEHTMAYLELTQENDMLLQNLIVSKMDFATLCNEVDALRKYNYTLEQRLLQFYRHSNDVL